MAIKIFLQEKMTEYPYSKKKTDRILNVLSNVASTIDRVANARLAAGLLYKGDFVSIGTNQFKSHPFQAQFTKHEEAIYLHAETDAIKNGLKVLSLSDLSKCTLFVCRIKQDMSYGLARPCEGCMRAIANFDIRRVYYTTGESNQIQCL